MIVFATSHLKGDAQNWWVHLQEEYWYIPPYNREANDLLARPRYRYPSWEEFCNTFHEQFHEPATEELHEARMGEVCIGNGPATIFFRTLECEAKLAGQRNDESKRGLLVQAVQRGIPQRYSSIISNIGVNVPHTYSEWKEQVLVMYEKQEKQRTYKQAHGREQRHDQKRPFGNQKQITATSTYKNTAGGATSSLTGKMGGNDKGRDSGG